MLLRSIRSCNSIFVSGIISLSRALCRASPATFPGREFSLRRGGEDRALLGIGAGLERSRRSLRRDLLLENGGGFYESLRRRSPRSSRQTVLWHERRQQRPRCGSPRATSPGHLRFVAVHRRQLPRDGQDRLGRRCGRMPLASGKRQGDNLDRLGHRILYGVHRCRGSMCP